MNDTGQQEQKICIMYNKNKMHLKRVSLPWSNKRNPANIACSESLLVTLEKTCSKLTIKTLERCH